MVGRQTGLVVSTHTLLEEPGEARVEDVDQGSMLFTSVSNDLLVTSSLPRKSDLRHERWAWARLGWLAVTAVMAS